MTEPKYFFEFELWEKGKQTQVVSCYADSETEAVEKLSKQYNGVFRIISISSMHPFDPYKENK